MKALVSLSHSWSPFLPLTCLYGQKWTFVGLSVQPSGVFSWEQVALLIIVLQDQWKKAKEANAKKVKEPTKNPEEAHD